MTNHKCHDCLFWEDGMCDKTRNVTSRNYSCDKWVSRNNKKEKEKLQLADSYVPNIWDEWKRKAILKDLNHE